MPLPPTGRTVHRLDPDGTIRDWLVSPVWSRPCDDLDTVLPVVGEPWGPNGRWVLTNGPDVAPLKTRLFARHPFVDPQALPALVEDGPLVWLTTGGPRPGTWTRRHVAADGFVDWSAFCFTPEYREAVAATRLEVDQAEERLLEVASTGPVRCWVGGELVLERDDITYMEPTVYSVRVRLPSRTTDLIVATWQVAFRECRHIARVRLRGLPVRVVIPNPTADEYRSAVAERVLAELASPARACAGDAMLTGPPGVALRADGAPVRLDATGRATIPLPAEGESILDLQLDDDSTPVTRRFAITRVPRAHRTVSVGTPAQWRTEVLEHVAASRGTAAGALARGRVAEGDLDTALHRITTRGDCADFEILGLLHLWHRVPAEQWSSALRAGVAEALIGMKYWITQPGLDAMCYFTENHQIVWHVAQRLAGLTWPTRRFLIDGRTGADHAAEGRDRAAAWIRRKLDGGFSEFDSNAYLAIDALALVSLVEFDIDNDLRAAAEALLDKTLLTLASNSWRGVHGAAHGRSYVRTLHSSRFEETAPILWLLAGIGALNEQVLPVAALATARVYRVPELVRGLITDEPSEWWGRQVYRGTYSFDRDLLDRPYGSDLRVWRTPAAMLSSVQDYRAGLPGLQEHIWGATLGPELQVFVTQPANADTSGSARPNAWAGQQVLPHARQDRDVVLAVHGASGTHLWLPVAHCDEWVQHGSWLAARAGRGLVAVATPGGVRPVRTGDTAWQEWLPVGAGTAWVATVGTGVDLHAWAAGLAEPRVEGDRLSWTAPDGRALQLSRDGAFLVNVQAVDLDETGRPEDPPHLDNPAVICRFGDQLLDAKWAGERLVLDLPAGRRLEPASGVSHDR